MTDMRLLIAFALVSSLTCAQVVAPTFEVASVKVDKSGPDAGNGFFPTPGRLRVTNMTFQQLIQAAYHINTGMLFRTAAWMESDRFDIDAKAAGNSSFEEDLVMLRALLADRFQLRFHRETRQLKTQALVVGKGGKKFQASKDQGQKERVTIRSAEISGTAIPFGHFVSILAAQLGYPITNETGLSGKYDLSLKYARDDSPGVDGPSVFTALSDQLGLKLERRTGPVEVFVIDSAERPRENQALGRGRLTVIPIAIRKTMVHANPPSSPKAPPVINSGPSALMDRNRPACGVPSVRKPNRSPMVQFQTACHAHMPHNPPSASA
jgi:uncharacterized protein (TIGR03435 family)